MARLMYSDRKYPEGWGGKSFATLFFRLLYAPVAQLDRAPDF